MRQAPKYWFRAKRHGWGWGLPIAWQGWATLALYAGVLIATARLLPEGLHPVAFYACVCLATLGLILVCQWKGERSSWHWGDDSH